MRSYQMLKRELEEMGMFAPEYKKAIPRYAKRIGVVTAPTGAAVRDIMNISEDAIRMYSYPLSGTGAGRRSAKNQLCVESVCWRQKMA